MTVQFGDDASRLIYPPASQWNNLSTYSVILWVNFDGFQASGFDNILFGKWDEASIATGWIFSYFGNATGLLLRFRIKFSTTNGIFNVNSLTLNAGTTYQLAFTYDQTSVSNVPIIYVNGVSQTVSVSQAPVGSASDNSAYNLVLGSAFGVEGFFGKALAVGLYNRILSAQEILDAYNGKLAIPTLRGLVLAPRLWGTAGNPGDGGQILAANTISDAITGALGTASGTPLFRQDNYLTFSECY